MNLTKLATLMATVGSLGGMLAGCGGGGGGSATPAPPPPPPTINLATKVVDGPIYNATVCFDKNDNGGCDADEPSGKTDTNGAVTLTVLEADAGKHALIAIVDTDAVDRDHGPVTQPYTLTTTADKPAVLSPLTTLVKAYVEASSLSTSDAEKSMQDQLGLQGSMFTDFSNSSGPDAATLAQLARVVVLSKARAYAALKAIEGTKDSDGNTITRGDIERVIGHLLAQEAGDFAALLGSDAVRNAGTPAELEAALNAAVIAKLGNPGQLDVAAAIAAMKQAKTATPDAPSAPAPGASLRWLTFSDAGNWYFRLFEATAQQNTVDSNGMRHFSEERKRAQNGVVEVWGASSNFTRTDLYWTGTEWFACPTGYEHSATPFDTAGNSESRYCNAWASKSHRAVRDIAGAKLSDIVREIRAYPLHDAEGDFSQWGLNPDDPRLANLSFPAGSKLVYQTSVDITNPPGYRPGDLLKIFNADVSQGVQAECNKVTSVNFADFQVQPKTLAEMVAGSPGTPCVYGTNSDTGPRNEWWSNSTVGLGTVAGPASANPYYTSNRALRIGFGAGQSVTFYSCAIRANGGSIRNCNPIGSGSYSIEALGDAQVMRFSGAPAEAAPLTYSRLFVERGGSVYYAYRTKVRASNSIRTNLEATDALFAPLGITR